MRILDTHTPFALILREANMVKPSVMAHLDPRGLEEALILLYLLVDDTYRIVTFGGRA
jgi:hypothetical protein